MGGVVLGAARLLVKGCVVGQDEALPGGVQHRFDPINHLGALVDPHLDEVAVTLTAGVAAELIEQLTLVSVEACLGDEVAVDGAQVFARFGGDGELFGEDEVQAHIDGRGGAGQACGAGSDDEQGSLFGVRDVACGNLGLNA